MCFAPQRRALFRHRNLQKWSEAGVFCTFSLGLVLRTTTAHTFSTSQLPKVVRPWCDGVPFFDISTSKSGPSMVCFVHFHFQMCFASRHNSVHFFISHLASWICGSGGSKSRLAKAAGAEPAGEMRDEKLHAVVARSTFRSQNGQNTRGADHFWTLRC